MSEWLRLKHVAEVVTSNVDKLKSESEVPVRLINYTDVYYGDRLTPDLPLMWATASASEIARHRVVDGDVLITKDSETADDIGVAAYVESTEDDMVCGYHLSRIRTKTSIADARYLFWALTGNHARGQMTVAATGVTRFGLRADSIRSLAIRVPSRREQRAIAGYLDIETGRIDALLSKKRRMIELLEERVGSLIDEMLLAEGYVGKEPDDPLDGAWEKLPAGWHVMPVKHLVGHLNSGAWGGEPGENEIEMPVATTAQISSDGQFDVCGMARRSFSRPEVAKFACRPGDIVVVKSSGSATNIISGKAGLVGDDHKTFVFSNFLMNLRPNRDVVEPRYLYMCLISTLTRERIKRMVSATTYPNLRVEEYLSSTLPVPPIVEQHRLVEEVGNQILEMRHLSSLTRKSLDLLTERRQALITAAVAGELCVSEVAV